MLHALGGQVEREVRQPSDIASGAREAGDKLASDRVWYRNKDDRYCRRGALCSKCSSAIDRNQNVDVERSQFGGETGKSHRNFRRKAVLQNDVLFLNVAEITEPFPHRPEITGLLLLIRCMPEKA